jgi:translation elongation factor EF-Ts
VGCYEGFAVKLSTEPQQALEREADGGSADPRANVTTMTAMITIVVIMTDFVAKKESMTAAATAITTFETPPAS